MISYSQNQALVINVNGKISLQSIICRRDKKYSSVLDENEPSKGEWGALILKEEICQCEHPLYVSAPGGAGGLGPLKTGLSRCPFCKHRIDLPHNIAFAKSLQESGQENRHEWRQACRLLRFALQNWPGGFYGLFRSLWARSAASGCLRGAGPSLRVAIGLLACSMAFSISVYMDFLYNMVSSLSLI